MAYLGRGVDVGMWEKQILIPDSTTTTFPLTFAVGSANSLQVVYGGVLQEPQVAYSVSGGGQQIVFSEAPATGTTTYIIYLGKQLTTPRAAGQETTKQTFSGDGSTVTFTLTDPPVVPAGIMVFVDGILQREGSGNNYVSSGSTITFTSAPDSSAEIDVYTLVKEKVSIDTVADGSITVTKLAAGHPTWNGAGETVIATASSGNSLRITNTGSGNSLLVEDSASTDSSPFVISAAGDVGVGTSSPAVKLDVAGNATVQNGVLTVGKDTIYDAFINTPESMYFNVDSDANSTGNRFVWGTDRAGNTGGTEWMRLDSSGNLGIGTTSPSGRLHVNSTGAAIAYIQSTLAAGNTNVETRYISTNRSWGVGQNIIQTSSIFEIADITANATRLAITSSGNVGIGTNNPSAKLQVTGTSATADVILDGNGSSNGGNLYFYADISGSGNKYRSSVSGINISNAGSGLTFSTINNGNTAPTERMRIDHNGNVGIGTSSPQTLFDVRGNGYFNSLRLNGANAVDTVYQSTGDLGIATATASNILFRTNNAERMRIDSNGNVGIGTASPSTRLQVGNPSDSNQALRFDFPDSSTARINSTRLSSGNLQSLQLAGQDTVQFLSNGSERMRIDNSGNLLVNQSALNGAGKVEIAYDRAASWGMQIRNTTGTTQPTTYIAFKYGSTQTGYIESTGTNTTYSTSSDYRLKENIAPMTNALAKVTALKPVTFKWKSTGVADEGFIAHELAEVVPQCVSGEKDAVNEDGSIKPQGIDTSFLVATLTAAIQELKAIVDAQAVEIAALKAK